MQSVSVISLFAFVMQEQKSPHHAVLTDQFKDVDMIQALLCTYVEHVHHLKHIHQSAPWTTSLGQLAMEAAGRSWLQINSGVLEQLVQHMLQSATEGVRGAQGIARTAYGAACSGRGEAFGALFAALPRAAEWHVGDFKAQNLANTAWAFATAS